MPRNNNPRNPGLSQTGLSAAEATARLADNGPNALPGGQRYTLWTIVWEAVREPMLSLLLSAGTQAFYRYLQRPRAPAVMERFGVTLAGAC